MVKSSRKTNVKTKQSRYDKQRAHAAKWARKQAARGKELGKLPKVVNPARRERGRKSTEAFGLEYFPRRFKLPNSAAHKTAIGIMQKCTDEGGKGAVAMPRGTGKTSWLEVAVIRAVAYGLRKFIPVICATAKLSARRLKSILKELETNDLLMEDFPEMCGPIRALGRANQRARSQTFKGKSTQLEITTDGIILATIPGAACSGAIIQVASMEGAIRGLNVLGPDGQPLRPDFVVFDDVQTRESAKSPLQTTDREMIVNDDAMGLAGPDVELAAIMLCTVCFPNDLSDRYLNREKYPTWQGVRTKMLESWPDMKLWDEYADIRRESWRSGDEGKRANAFYAEHREEMDRGAVVSWPERKKKGELSGLQSAMNLYIDNPRGFKAEYQNEPDSVGGTAAAKELRADLVAARLSGLPRYEIPREASRQVAFVDPGSELLWYGVTAWDGQFGGAVVDYGAWPQQNRAFFAASDPRPGLSQQYPGLSESERVYAGLGDVLALIMNRVYYREATGEQIRVERCLIDSGWQAAMVYKFCRESPFAASIYPSKGIGRTQTSRGVSEWKPRPGERSGYHWRLTMSETGRGQMVQFDPDAWKSFLYERLTTAPGGRGGLNLFGKSIAAHEMIAEHCAAEGAEPKTLRGSTFDKWDQKPHRPDNHLLDTLVGCCLAASVCGLVWSPTAAPSVEAAKPKIDHAAEFKKRKQEFEARRGF